MKFGVVSGSNRSCVIKAAHFVMNDDERLDVFALKCGLFGVTTPTRAIGGSVCFVSIRKHLFLTETAKTEVFRDGSLLNLQVRLNR